MRVHEDVKVKLSPQSASAGRLPDRDLLSRAQVRSVLAAGLERNAVAWQGSCLLCSGAECLCLWVQACHDCQKVYVCTCLHSSLPSWLPDACRGQQATLTLPASRCAVSGWATPAGAALQLLWLATPSSACAPGGCMLPAGAWLQLLCLGR